jgi:homoprotocatechuate degradation regulator HpaR
MNYVDINEVPAFSTSLPMQLYRALDAIMPEYRNLFYKYDLTEQQWRILRVLWTENNITVAQLSKITLLPAPSLVGILDRLVKKNLLIRNRSDKDRRQVQISLTTKGQELQQLVAPSVLAIHSRLKARVSNDEWQSLERLLKKFSV